MAPPLDADARMAIEHLRNFLHMGVNQLADPEAFSQFRASLDAVMSLGLLDSTKLDELQTRLAEGEEMLARFADVRRRMVEGCSLDEELDEIKERTHPAMASLKDNELLVQRENEELVLV